MEFSEAFYLDPYQTEFDAQVISCTSVKKGFEVVLSDTCFYPEGGGQPCDLGALEWDGGRISVLDVKRDKDDRVLHLLKEEIPAGVLVHGKIDWERRFSLMQNHSGEHIVSGLVNRNYGYENVGFHMGDVITIDLSGVLTWEQAIEIERRANRVVWENRSVDIIFPDAGSLDSLEYRSKKELSGRVRLINIEDADSCACCGLHVRNTGEIGLIKLLSLIRYKGGVRIEMVCGEKALFDYERKLDDNTEIKNLLSVKPHEVTDAVKRIMEESGEKSERIAKLNSRYTELRIRELSAENGVIVDLEEDMNNIELRKFCDALNKSGKADISAVLATAENEGPAEGAPALRYCIASNVYDMKSLTPELNKELNGRGGGSKEMIQGTFHASMEEIWEAIRRKLK